MRQPSRTAHAVALACAAALWSGSVSVVAAAQDARDAPEEPTAQVELLDNPDFDAPPSDAAPDRIPWWRTTRGAPRLEPTGLEGDLELVLPAGSAVEQPLAVPPELVDDVYFIVRATDAVLVVRDGLGGEVRTLLQPELREASLGSANLHEIELPVPLPLSKLTAEQGVRLVPRLTVALEVADGADEARLRGISASARFPCPTEDALAAEITRELESIFALWLERGLDRVGPRETAFLSTVFDARTGEPLAHLEGGANPFYALLRRALAVHEDPEWSAALERYLEDLFALGFHPGTGLPRKWDVLRDVPDDETPREVAFALGHLLDFAEEGPEEWRERALARAVRIGEVVLAKGVLPTGEIAARYRPRDGEPSTSYPPLRRLDVPAQLARLGAATDDARFTDAARDAFVQFEFIHHWPGTWQAIDPGFDDDFGHYGARSVLAWQAHPGEEVFANVALSGARHYLPLWRDALRLGGNVAADQVRCWEILADTARLEPSLREEAGELVRLAARNHFKGEQYDGGAWGDVTIWHFDPKAHLEVGDLPGLPQNLVQGLAFAYDDVIDLRTDEIRALFTAVYRSSRQHYRREFGYLSTRTERAGANPAGGGFRLAVGLVEMLRRLEDAR